MIKIMENSPETEKQINSGNIKVLFRKELSARSLWRNSEKRLMREVEVLAERSGANLVIHNALIKFIQPVTFGFGIKPKDLVVYCGGRFFFCQTEEID